MLSPILILACCIALTSDGLRYYRTPLEAAGGQPPEPREAAPAANTMEGNDAVAQICR